VTVDILLLILVLPLAANVAIRMIGLSPRLFIRHPWDNLSLALVTTVVVCAGVSMALPTASTTITSEVLSIARVAVLLSMVAYVPAFQELFEVAAASIPLVSTLLATWFVFLLFFAIGLTQAFGVTRFGPNESGNVNFRTVPKALILLFRITLGEGRTKIMEDFAAIVPPYCTVGPRYFETDCGDTVLARLFFISWKVLSMYLFTSLFISLVYESFSNVYQELVIKNGTLTRKDIRVFKDAWARADLKGTGYISPEQLPRLLCQLPERLNMRVYDDKYSVASLKKECEHRLPLAPGELDVTKLNTQLKTLPHEVIRERRQAVKRFRMEILMMQDPSAGISMQTALITLVYYNMADPRDYLK
jgi:hypothetical protein